MSIEQEVPSHLILIMFKINVVIKCGSEVDGFSFCGDGSETSVRLQ